MAPITLKTLQALSDNEASLATDDCKFKTRLILKIRVGMKNKKTIRNKIR